MIRECKNIAGEPVVEQVIKWEILAPIAIYRCYPNDSTGKPPRIITDHLLAGFFASSIGNISIGRALFADDGVE